MKITADKSIPLIQTFFSENPFALELVSDIYPETLKDSDVLICRSTLKVNQALLHGSKIKYVLTTTSGTDHIDISYLADQNITLIDAKGGNAQSVCDYVLSLIAEREDGLNGKKIGVIGYGEVGQRVAKSLSHYGFDVCIADPLKAKMYDNFKETPLRDLIDSDVISLHVPLTTDGLHPTKQLINEAFLSKLRPNTLFINTSRGEVVDEKALLHHQDKLTICLDVFENEPLPNQTLLKHCDSATPHIAGHALEAKLRSSLLVYRKLMRLLKCPIQTFGYEALLVDPPLPNSLSGFKSYYSTKEETQQLKAMRYRDDFIALRKAHNRPEYHHSGLGSLS